MQEYMVEGVGGGGGGVWGGGGGGGGGGGILQLHVFQMYDYLKLLQQNTSLHHSC